MDPVLSFGASIFYLLQGDDKQHNYLVAADNST